MKGLAANKTKLETKGDNRALLGESGGVVDESDSQRAQRTVLVLGESRPSTGGIATVINDTFSSSLTRMFRLVLFDTRKRTRQGRTFVEGICAQLFLLTSYSVKLLLLRPDLVHIHVGGSNDIFRKGWDVMIAKLLRTRVLLHIHGGDFDRFFAPGNEKELKHIQRVFQRSNGVVALSEFWRSLYARILDRKRIYVVNNSIDVDLYRSLDRVAARRELDIPLDASVVLHLGSQGTRKGTFDLLRAIPSVLKVAPETVVLLVGPDEDVHPGAIAEGEALASDLGISRSVRFLGARTGQDKLHCLGAADVFVLPSYNENFPISILEAMASGLPVISTRVGGIPEILSRSTPDDLVEPGDSAAIANRIKAYVGNHELCRESGARNRSIAEEWFNLDLFATRLADTYKTACG